MKKRGDDKRKWHGVLIFLVMFLFIFGAFSLGFFSNFWGKITGKATGKIIDVDAILYDVSCEDIDNSLIGLGGSIHGVDWDSTGGHDDLGSFEFGKKDYISIPDDDELDFDDSLTIAAWVYYDKKIGSARLISKERYYPGYGAKWSYRFLNLDDGAFGYHDALLIQLSDDGTSNTLPVQVNHALKGLENKWLFHAATYDGETLKLYLDYPGNPNDPLIGAKDGDIEIFESRVGLGIGADSVGTWSFKGGMEDVLLLDEALSAEELKAVMDGNCLGSQPAPTEPSEDSQDIDGDGIINEEDNCIEVPNPNQIDTNLDGYGNACDADYDNNGVINSVDFNPLFLEAFNAQDPADVSNYLDFDFNGDGVVDGADFTFFNNAFSVGGPSGPSGLSCAGTIPCGEADEVEIIAPLNNETLEEFELIEAPLDFNETNLSEGTLETKNLTDEITGLLILEEDKAEVCGGCLFEDRCYPLGYRKNGNYCSDGGDFFNYLVDGSSCENDFECISNSCISGECVEIDELVEEEIGALKNFVVKTLCGVRGVFQVESFKNCVEKQFGPESIHGSEKDSGFVVQLSTTKKSYSAGEQVRFE